MILAILPGLGVVFIQLLYWKIVTGQWIYYSYQDNQGQVLEITKPYILEVFLSARKGLFIYTPLSILMIIGIFYLKKVHTEWLFPILIFSIINLYLISSWTCWWYAESFGQRTIIPMYSIFALGFAAFLSNLIQRKITYKVIAFLVIIAIVILNLFQTWQIRQGILTSNYISKDYYLSVFGQTTPVTESQKELLLQKPIDGFIPNDKGPNLELFNKEFTYSIGITDSITLNSNKISGVLLNSNNPYSAGLNIPNKYLNNSEFKYMHITGCIGLTRSKIPKFGIVSNMERNGNQYNWFMSQPLVKEEVNRDTQFLSYWLMCPKIDRDKDLFKVFIWNPSTDSLLFYGLKVDVYSPKIKKNIFFW
ncbi:MAG: hypothetical protein IT265_00440 [Saprospiraceae bacterium]|nr:hypothetical protein [Saprospiraceae bacterium]